jgi:hypothetical protein
VSSRIPPQQASYLTGDGGYHAVPHNVGNARGLLCLAAQFSPEGLLLLGHALHNITPFLLKIYPTNTVDLGCYFGWIEKGEI